MQDTGYRFDLDLASSIVSRENRCNLVVIKRFT